MKTLLISVILLMSLSVSVWCEGATPTSLNELAKYTGTDRTSILYDGAKKEGKIVWYTSLVPYKQIAKFFETKYPGVKVEAYRSSGRDIAPRVLTEAQTKRYLVDVVETTPGTLMVLRDNKVLLPYTSPSLGNFPADAKEEVAGGLVLWASDRESYIGVGYNKNVIPSADIPKTFADLLKPALKGKMGITGDETAAKLIGAMIKAKGESFVRKLKSQKIVLHPVNPPALNELIVTGEVPLSFTAFNTNIDHSAAKGAPVAWVPMDLVVANAGGVAVSSDAQHPHAAFLFADFLLGPEGQKMLAKFRYGSAAKDYGFKRWYPEKGLTTAEYLAKTKGWIKLITEITSK